MTRNQTRRQFERAYNDNIGAVHAYARRRVGPDQVEDVVGEVFLVAWRRIEDLPEDPLPWLLGIARGVIANQLRGQRRWRALQQKLALEPPETVLAPTLTEIDPDLAAALRRLTDDDRELLCLLAWEQLTREQAAVALGCRPAALRLRLLRARRRLARELGRHTDTSHEPASSDVAPGTKGAS